MLLNYPISLFLAKEKLYFLERPRFGIETQVIIAIYVSCSEASPKVN